MMQRLFLIFVLPLFLAACGAQSVWAPDDVVAKSIYRHDAPPSLTLITMKNVGSDNGAHTSLLVNASQRVLFDPAGTFSFKAMVERNDVIYGMSPQLLDVYIDYHSRITYYTVTQTIQISPEVAEQVLQDVKTFGAVPKANCNRAISQILGRTPGFESIRTSFFPNNTEEAFSKLPNVRRQSFYDDDPDDNKGMLRDINLN